MPSITIRVRSVLPRTVGRYNQTQKFDVIPVLEPGQLAAALYETFDELKASLCERASVQGFPVRIVWKDSKWGREIVTAARVREEEAIDEIVRQLEN